MLFICTKFDQKQKILLLYSLSIIVYRSKFAFQKYRQNFSVPHHALDGRLHKVYIYFFSFISIWRILLILWYLSTRFQPPFLWFSHSDQLIAPFYLFPFTFVWIYSLLSYMQALFRCQILLVLYWILCDLWSGQMFFTDRSRNNFPLLSFSWTQKNHLMKLYRIFHFITI